MRRKALYKKGDVVVCELYDEAVKILDVKLEKLDVPWGKLLTWEYKVKSPDTGKMVWIDDQQITGQVKYQPLVLKPERHVELCNELVEYERYRDFLETLKPKTKADRLTVRLLKELVENVARVVSDETSSNEYEEFYGEMEALMR